MNKVNHPSHYKSNGLEAIDVIEAFFYESFNLGNAFKYMARAGRKNDYVEDLQKAVWYLEREIDNNTAYIITEFGKLYYKLSEYGIYVEKGDYIAFTDKYGGIWTFNFEEEVFKSAYGDAVKTVDETPEYNEEDWVINPALPF
ncbi:DUF3310 domain-containing protein [Corynebacterium pyruviciproducens]|uniref:DUF3310 domain-containing protein n=1 Tax=Corynebacterium pyruviciproducens TaxID=598660 RepID=A0AAF0YU37_9CORY|nr:DUF3310 domain-containing protein [Corynebacterium pyruviciproducens]WOT03404.1 DUF3310 domain-containing protein [Corynebacterium pyruviciproducens]